ncbi:MAG: right-handed parallel beta-helix repeat-containing protein, partial [Treponema sp.]|nr:right-handed parallel beta-helix repeat-containing protein [Treponema sp.]
LIRSNTAASGGGAGLGLRGVFIMNGGEISDNAAVAVNSYTGNGGGVDASGNYTGGGEAVFTMRGNAAISGNAASVSGGGVYVNNASFAMSGGARVNPGNEIFLCEDQVISVEGNLTADAPAAAIQPETYPLGGALTAIKILDGETADVAANNAKFSVLPRAEGEQWAIDPDGNLYLAAYLVTNTNDAGTGSLRQAIALASGGDTIKLDLPPGSEIRLESSLEIDKNLTIEGNGVTLTRNLSVGPIQLAQIGNFTVTVRRVRFTGGGGDTVSQGGAIFSDAAYLALESCIFSNNYASTNGGAVINNNAAGTLDIKGCTFYSNSTSYYYGGAVYNSGDLVLTGNLFYGNTAPYGPVAGPYFPGTITSAGYNMVDKPFGTGFDDCGWDQVAGDRQITGLSFSPLTYKVFPDSEMTAIPVLPENYPSFDFYGNAINPGNWYPGAVQSTTAAGMNYLDLAYDAGRGGVTVNPLPDPDGLVPEGTALAVTASAGYEFLQWLRWQWVEDEWSPGEYIFEPVEYDTAVLLLNGMEKYTKVEAVFGLAVTSAGDGPASEQTPGTLRFALAQARDGDLIRVSVPEIYLTRRLVVDIESNSGVTIEGGGVKLARQEPYTADGDPGLLSVSGYGVTMRGTHFTGGSTEGNGGAVSVFGDLTLQSCIFSGNSADNDGGAVYVSGQSYVRIAGCTFYNNSAGSAGGAVCFNAVYSTNQLILTGNLFYGNTAGQCTVNILWGTLSPSYNVVDLDYGTANGQIGWAADPTDNLFYHSLGGGLGITDDPPFDPETFAPVAGLEDVMPDQDTVSTYVIFPATDFYGNERTWPGAPGAVNSEQ